MFIVIPFELPNSNTFFSPDILSRVSIFLLLQIVVFFFLKQYRLHQEEIKYYNNELLMVDSWVMASKLSAIRSIPEIESKVIETILAFDRNKIISKDDTTALIRAKELVENSINTTLSNYTNNLKAIIETTKTQ
jgi:hypothetical protein